MVVATAEPEAAAGAADVVAAAAAAAAAAGSAEEGLDEEALGKPQPVLVFWNWAPVPEQMPMGLAQQAEPQSASLRHWPPMNWVPAPFPTFLAPEGSNERVAEASRVTGCVRGVFNACLGMGTYRRGC